MYVCTVETSTAQVQTVANRVAQEDYTTLGQSKVFLREKELGAEHR